MRHRRRHPLNKNSKDKINCCEIKICMNYFEKMFHFAMLAIYKEIAYHAGVNWLFFSFRAIITGYDYDVVNVGLIQTHFVKLVDKNFPKNYHNTALQPLVNVHCLP